MQEKHAILTLDEKANKINIKPCNTDCRVLVNGTPIQGETTLCHNDRSVVINSRKPDSLYRSLLQLYLFFAALSIAY